MRNAKTCNYPWNCREIRTLWIAFKAIVYHELSKTAVINPILPARLLQAEKRVWGVPCTKY